MRALVKANEVIILDDRTDPFVLKHLAWMQTQGYVLDENWEPPTIDEPYQAVSEVTETASGSVTASEETVEEETVTLNGKTYTKAELKKLLE